MALKVAVVMPGHLATTPRMLKTADSLSRAGYEVRAISAGFENWARDADVRTSATRPWRWQVVEHSRERAPIRYIATGIRRHVARHAARTVGTRRAPWWACTRALSRVHDELVSVACREPLDLVIAGSVGGLGVAEAIGRRARVPFAVDLEDFHPAESVAADASLCHGLARRVLSRVLPRAAFVTTSSECMAARYREQFGIVPAILHNVFHLPAEKPVLARDGGPLRLYWFSQTIACGRGIEDMMTAVEHAAVPAEITLRGRSTDAIATELRRRAAAITGLRLRIEPPADPDSMAALCAAHHVGWSAEIECVENRRLCLANKVFTYLLGALPVALNDTIAQRRLASQLEDAAFLYPSGNVRSLSEWLRSLASNPERLRHHREAAWRQAVRRWHWEHEAEEGQLLSLVQRVLA